MNLKNTSIIGCWTKPVYIIVVEEKNCHDQYPEMPKTNFFCTFNLLATYQSSVCTHLLPQQLLVIECSHWSLPPNKCHWFEFLRSPTISPGRTQVTWLPVNATVNNIWYFGCGIGKKLTLMDKCLTVVIQKGRQIKS